MKLNQSSVLTTEKKKKSPLKGILLALLVILLVIGTCVGLRYQKGGIDGNWVAVQLDKKLENDLNKGMREFEESAEFNAKGIISKPKLMMDVKDGNVTTRFKMTIDKKLFSKRVLAFYDEQLKKNFGNDITYNDLDPEVKKTLEESLPTASDIEAMLDKGFLQNAKEIGGTYDAKTGVLSAVAFKGEVNRILHTIKLTYVNDKAAKGLANQKGKNYSYSLKEKRLKLEGADESYTFKK
ncbi:hypothetical protein DIX60_01560 [Streptococcus iniae]|uniref:hypothetical protein n=1 Tax=Streptococcus iniae TaxID=1346 RepID=UPI000EF71CE3|nr:hypothetical protein [Streptococcus iniae]RLV28481.1 hypothetical protein DIX60_01560 [Streptococcus iniae]